MNKVFGEVSAVRSDYAADGCPQTKHPIERTVEATGFIPRDVDHWQQVLVISRLLKRRGAHVDH